MRFTIGQNIRAARTKHKMTLRYLSRKSGVPENKIDQYELGKNDIVLEHILKLACVLKIEIQSLLAGSSLSRE